MLSQTDVFIFVFSEIQTAHGINKRLSQVLLTKHDKRINVRISVFIVGLNRVKDVVSECKYCKRIYAFILGAILLTKRHSNVSYCSMYLYSLFMGYIVSIIIYC